ncbi:OmpA family protein [Vibrio harveyi]
MIKNILNPVVLLCGIFTPIVSHADFYIGGKIGSSNVVNSCEVNLNCNSESFSVGFYGGYDFDNYISAEIGYDFLGIFDSNYKQLNDNFKNNRLAVSALTFAPKFNYMLMRDLDVFGKIGAAQLLSHSERDMVTVATVGLEYVVDFNLKLRGEYQYFREMRDQDIYNLDTNVFSLGVTYSFGDSENISVEEEIVPQDAISVVVSPKDVNEIVFFEFNSTVVSEQYYGRLKDVVTFMELYPNTKATILGYTDSVGDAEYNLNLSLERAQVVAKFIIKNGIASNRLLISGEGETEESKDDAINRHVDVMIEKFTYETKK